MSETAEIIDITAKSPKQDFYAVSEIPPLGQAPKPIAPAPPAST